MILADVLRVITHGNIHPLFPFPLSGGSVFPTKLRIEHGELALVQCIQLRGLPVAGGIDKLDSATAS